mgnify:CR=1 FL=1
MVFAPKGKQFRSIYSMKASRFPDFGTAFFRSHEYIRTFGDGTRIEDQCRILEHYKSSEQDGLCYDWYYIDSHYRNIEKDAATYAEMAAAIREGVNSVD